MTCPGDIELSRALGAGAGPELASHLEACPTCRVAWDGVRAAIDLARELTVPLPTPERREEVRTAVLAAAAGRAHRPARRTWLVPAIVAAAAAGIAGYFAISHPASPPASPPHAHGVVRPHPGARYVLGSLGPDEVVQLSDGVIDIEVEPLHPGERFRVVVGTAELEVRGTAFTVTAQGERLVEVAVARGRVDLTSEAASASLTAGQSWHAPVAAAEVVHPPVSSPPPPVHATPPRPHRVATAPHRDAEPPPVPASAPAPAPAPPPPARSPAEVSYDDAWTALRTGDFAHAASGFARVALLAPDSPLVEDASYWRAVALARGQRGAEAVSAFRDFLDGYARSARAGEASAMLGWLLVDARAYDEAARRFAAATGDASAQVRGSAQAGLDALARHKR